MRRTATGARVTEVTVMGVVTGKATTSTVAVALTVGEVSPGGPFRRQDWSCRPLPTGPPRCPHPHSQGQGQARHSDVAPCGPASAGVPGHHPASPRARCGPAVWPRPAALSPWAEPSSTVTAPPAAWASARLTVTLPSRFSLLQELLLPPPPGSQCPLG